MSAPVRKPTERELQLIAATALRHILDVTGLPAVVWSITPAGYLEGQTRPWAGQRTADVLAAFAEVIDAEPRTYGDDGTWMEVRGIYLGAPVRVSGCLVAAASASGAGAR